MLEGRRAEKDFLLRNDPKQADDQIKIGKAVIADIDKLRGKIVAIGNPGTYQVEAMSDLSISGAFRNGRRTKAQLGLDEQSGLEGRLRASVHDIEAREAS